LDRHSCFIRSDFALGTQSGGMVATDFHHDGMLDLAATDSVAQT
jgi:hypothetical protein